MDVCKQASTQKVTLCKYTYQPSLLSATVGVSTNSFNGLGEKGTSSFKFQGVCQHVKNPDVPTTVVDWNIYPAGKSVMLKRVAREYPNSKTITILVNGLCYKDK